MVISITLPDNQARTLAALAAREGTALGDYVQAHLVQHAEKAQARMDGRAAMRRCAKCRHLNAGLEIKGGIVAAGTCYRCGKDLTAAGDPFVSCGLGDFVEIMGWIDHWRFKGEASHESTLCNLHTVRPHRRSNWRSPSSRWTVREMKGIGLRKDLQKHEGERRRFWGTFERFGWKNGWSGRSVRTVLIKDVKDETGKILTDHLWFTCSKQFDALPLSNGCKVAFDARVKSYRKGWRGDFDFDKPAPSTDYKLSHPTKIEVLT